MTDEATAGKTGAAGAGKLPPDPETERAIQEALKTIQFTDEPEAPERAKTSTAPTPLSTMPQAMGEKPTPSAPPIPPKKSGPPLVPAAIVMPHPDDGLPSAPVLSKSETFGDKTQSRGIPILSTSESSGSKMPPREVPQAKPAAPVLNIPPAAELVAVPVPAPAAPSIPVPKPPAPPRETPPVPTPPPATQPTPAMPPVIKAESEKVKQDFAQILASTKLPERRDAATKNTASSAPAAGLVVRAAAPAEQQPPADDRLRQELSRLSSSIPKEHEVRLVTPEGSSAPVLSHPSPPAPPPFIPKITTVAPPTLEKNITGELSPIAPPPSPTSENVPQPVAALITPETPATQVMPEGRPDKRPVVTSLRTLKDDLRDLVKVRKMSLIHAATLESERKAKGSEAEAEAAATRAKYRVRSIRFIALLVLLVALAGAALFAVFAVQSQRSGGSATNFGNGLVFAEQTLSFPLLPDLSPLEVRTQLSSARNQGSLTLGAMQRIVPTVFIKNQDGTTETQANAREFVRALVNEPPADLMRSLGEEFFFGVHTVDQNVPVIILPITQYQTAFAGMLEWEPLMNEALHPLFTRVHYEKLDAEGVPVIARFEDVLIKNYDVRAMRDENGDIRMLYSFPSRNYLIISESPHSFVEALARLRAERRL